MEFDACCKISGKHKEIKKNIGGTLLKVSENLRSWSNKY